MVKVKGEEKNKVEDKIKVKAEVEVENKKGVIPWQRIRIW